MADEQTFTTCCSGCDPSCEGPATCADRAWAEVERLRAALRYIGQPTLSLPGDADAVQYVLVADERAVRLALQTCIRIAREALVVEEARREQ